MPDDPGNPRGEVITTPAPEYEVPGLPGQRGRRPNTRVVNPRGRGYTPGPTGPWPAPRPRPRVVNPTTGGANAQSTREVSFNAAQGVIPVGYGYIKSGVGFALSPKVIGGFVYTAGVLGEGENDSIVTTKIDGRLAVDIGATVNSYTGTAGQTVDTMLQGIEPLWITPLANLAYHALKIPVPNATTGDFDITRIETVWKGKKVYDPRSGLTVWSDNPALIWADVATSTRYGGRIPSAKIDWDSVAEAANDCDAVIATGPAAPGAALAAALVSGGGSLLLSQLGYTWTYTNVDVNGYESAESPASNSLIVNDGDSAALSAVAVGGAGTTKRRIYRTKIDSLAPRRLVGTINDNTTTIYTDTVADSALGGFSQPGPYKRYTLDLFMQNAAAWPAWDETIRAHFACIRVYSNGKHKLIVDKAKAVSGITFTDTGPGRTITSDGLPRVRTKGTRERPGLVTVSYIDRFNDYATASVSWPDPEPAGTKVEERFEFQGIPGNQALRLAKYLYNLRLRDREYTMRTLQRGALPLPGAIVEVTSRRGPLTAEKMLLLNTEPDGPAWNHQLENYDAAVYSDSVTVTLPPVVTPPPDPHATPPNVTGLTAPTTPESKIGSIYWTSAVHPNTAGYEIFDNRTAPAQLIMFVPAGSQPSATNLLHLLSYVTTNEDGSREFNVKVVTLSTGGTRSSGATVSWTLAAPAAPRDVTIYNTNGAAILKQGTGWAAVRGAAAGDSLEQDTTPLHVDSAMVAPAGDFKIWRGFLEFDASADLPADPEVISAQLELDTVAGDPARSSVIHVCESTAGDAPFAVGDYSAVGSTSFGYEPFDNLDAGGGYTVIELNAAAVAVIQAALDAGNLVKLALRTGDDILNTTPTYGSDIIEVLFVGTEGAAQGVRLTITYRSVIEDQTQPPLSAGNVINRFSVPQEHPQPGNAALDGEFRAATFEGLLPVAWREIPVGAMDGVNDTFTMRFPVLDGEIAELGDRPLYGNGKDYTRTDQTLVMEPHAIPTPIDAAEEGFRVTYNRGQSAGRFVDNAGNVYDVDTGNFVSAAGPDTADVDGAYGYSFDGGTNETKAGVTAAYADWVIGDLDTDAGYQGPTGTTNRTRLKLGVGSSSDRLLGCERKNSGGGSSDAVWTINIRNATTGAIIATLATPNFIGAWFDAHPTEYSGADTDYDVHISADPIDGSFWINVKEGDGVISVLPMWNISAADGSLIREVEIDFYAPGTTVRRIERRIP